MAVNSVLMVMLSCAVGDRRVFGGELAPVDRVDASEPALADSADGSPPAGVTGTEAVPAIAVYVGYYDTHHHADLEAKPSPWKGSSRVVFVGTSDNSSGGWDTSAIRIENLGSSTLTMTVKVDIGTHHYALWGARSVPAGYRLILAQTGFENFDGSDTNPAGCTRCDPNLCVSKVVSTKPVVHVTIGSTTTNYTDSKQVLNTKGVDAAGCPYTGTRKDESQSWQNISSTAKPGSLEMPIEAEDPEPVARPEAYPMLAVYPNPTHGDLQLRFHMPASGPVRLTVHDVSGRLVRVCMDQTLEAGNYLAAANLESSTPGVYFAELRVPGSTQHAAFLILR